MADPTRLRDLDTVRRILASHGYPARIGSLAAELADVVTMGRAESAERIAALQRDAEMAAAAENANAADLKAARGLLAEQQRAFVVAVEAMEARHDAEIAAVVEGLRTGAARDSAYARQYADHEAASATWPATKTATAHAARAVALSEVADSIATTHAAALARHAGRNTTAEVPRD